MKKILVVIILIAVGFGGYYLYQKSKNPNYQIYVPKDKTVEESITLEKIWPLIQNSSVPVPYTNIKANLKDGTQTVVDQNQNIQLELTRAWGPFDDVKNTEKKNFFAELTMYPGGSGIFNYLVVFTYSGKEISSENYVFIGDRIAISDVVVSSSDENGYFLDIKYLDRAPEDPFSANPNIEKIKKVRIEDGKILPTGDGIFIQNILENQKINNPVLIKGLARGNWFFEASFPVFVVDWDGKIIGDGIATAQGEWMTSDFVPFTASIKFEKPEYGDNGAIILKKDNPSGLPENDGALEFQIKF